MKINYELKLKDHLSFFQYYCSNSKVIRKSRLQAKLALIPFLIVWLFIVVSEEGIGGIFVVMIIMLCLLYVVYLVF